MDKTDPTGEDRVGEMIDSAAGGCGAASCGGWAALHAVWSVFGAEGVSQLVDKGWSSASVGDKASAGFELMAALPPVKIAGEVAEAVKAEGVVYERINMADLAERPYIGQPKSDSRFAERQKEHVRANPDAEYKYSVVDRAEPGRALDEVNAHRRSWWTHKQE